MANPHHFRFRVARRRFVLIHDGKTMKKFFLFCIPFVCISSVLGGCSKSQHEVDTSNVVTPERQQKSEEAMRQGMAESQRKAREEAAAKAAQR